VKPIIVPRLRVESVTGPTCYPGENGFSGLTAYVERSDLSILTRLRLAAKEGTVVTIRCAKLEIEGHVGNLHVTDDGNDNAVAIRVDDLRYFKHGRKD
jgi:hypothetical protein